MRTTGTSSRPAACERPRSTARSASGAGRMTSDRAAAIPGAAPKRPAKSAMSSANSYPRWSARGRNAAHSETAPSAPAYTARPRRPGRLAASRGVLSSWDGMVPSDADRRTAPRGPIRLRVDYERMNSFFADYTKNISKGGTFIKTARPLPIGTRFLFALSVPALSEPVQITGKVQWIRAETPAPTGPDDEPGMGIRFVFTTDEERICFERLVQGLMEHSLGPDVTRGLLGR